VSSERRCTVDDVA